MGREEGRPGFETGGDFASVGACGPDSLKSPDGEGMLTSGICEAGRLRDWERPGRSGLQFRA